jgi:hypothetical protein
VTAARRQFQKPLRAPRRYPRRDKSRTQPQRRAFPPPRHKRASGACRFLANAPVKAVAGAGVGLAPNAAPNTDNATKPGAAAIAPEAIAGRTCSRLRTTLPLSRITSHVGSAEAGPAHFSFTWPNRGSRSRDLVAAAATMQKSVEPGRRCWCSIKRALCKVAHETRPIVTKRRFRRTQPMLWLAAPPGYV